MTRVPGYARTGWTEPKAGTVVAAVRDLLLRRAVTTEDLSELSPRRSHGYLRMYLRDQCGYVISSWSDPSLPHETRMRRRFRITGRLAWSGGVGEDYTIMVEERVGGDG